MLATEAGLDELPRLVASDEWSFDQKLDGQRRLVAVEDGRARAFRRSGAAASLPRDVERDLGILAGGDWLVDGELVDDVLWVFDLVRAPSERISERTPYAERRSGLDGIAAYMTTSVVRVLPSCHSSQAKQAIVDTLRSGGGEGVVARHLDGTYEFGTRSRWMFKAKFFREIDVVVTGLRVEGKDNFAISLIRDGELIEIGTCSALFRGLPAIAVGQVVTVRYLYANDRGHLQHPTRPRLRDDKDPEECTFDQLVYRSTSVIDLAL